MWQFAIVGATFSGLYTAQRLLAHGINATQLIIISQEEPGNSENISCFEYETMHRVMQVSGIRDTTCQRKTLENALYQKLLTAGVTFVTACFKEIILPAEAGDCYSTLMIEEDAHLIRKISVRYVFDCSGRSAVVAESINQQLSKIEKPTAFVARELAPHYPIQERLTAEVRFSSPIQFEASLLSQPAPLRMRVTHPSPVMAQLENLKQRFGWDFPVIPFMQVHAFRNNHFVVTVEIPKGLAEDQQGNWMDALFAIYSGLTEHQLPLRAVSHLSRHTYSPRIMNSPYAQGVFLGFNVLNRADYLSGRGYQSGVSYTEALLDSLVIRGGRVLGFGKNFDRVITDNYEVYLASVAQHAHLREAAVLSGLEIFCQHYLEMMRKDPGSLTTYRLSAKEVATQILAIRCRILSDLSSVSPGQRLKTLSLCLAALVRMEANRFAYEDSESLLQTILFKLWPCLDNRSWDATQIRDSRILCDYEAMFIEMLESFAVLTNQRVPNERIVQVKQILQAIQDELQKRYGMRARLVPSSIVDSLLSVGVSQVAPEYQVPSPDVSPAVTSQHPMPCVFTSSSGTGSCPS